MLLIGGSGLMLWFPTLVTRILPGGVLNVAQVAAFGHGRVVAGCLFLMHFFNTHLRPEKFPMDLSVVTGVVSEEHLRRARPEYLERLRREGKLQQMQTAAPSRSGLRLAILARLAGDLGGAVALGIEPRWLIWGNDVMDENRPVPPPSAGDPGGPPLPPAGSDPRDAEGEVNFWQNLRWFLSRGVALIAAFVLMGAALTGLAGWYTSRSEFCRSCHIMEPYYVSWQESSHHDVSCIKCHFPPGAGEKIRGKMLGLVQLVKYVTATAGPDGLRPRSPTPAASAAAATKRGCCPAGSSFTGCLSITGRTWKRSNAASSCAAPAATARSSKAAT